MFNLGDKVKINCYPVEYPLGEIVQFASDGYFQQRLQKIYILQLEDGRKLQVAESLLILVN